MAAQHYLMSRDHDFGDVVAGGEASPSGGVEVVQWSRSECDAKCDAISADRIELLARAVVLVAGMNLAEAERAAVLGRVIADLTNPTTRIPE